MGQNSYTKDALLDLAASAARTASGNGTALDLGAGRVNAVAVVDVSAIDIVTGDESYRLRLQVSNDPTFATGVVTAASLELGDSSVTGSSADSVVGRREVGFINEVAGVRYRYARLAWVIAGTTPTITFAAWLAGKPAYT